MNEKCPIRGQVVDRHSKSPADRRGEAAFDLDSPGSIARQFQGKVDFGTGYRPVEAGVRAIRCGPDQGFYGEAFPTRSSNWVAEHGVHVVEPQQRMDDAAYDSEITRIINQ